MPHIDMLIEDLPAASPNKTRQAIDVFVVVHQTDTSSSRQWWLAKLSDARSLESLALIPRRKPH
jgi:hypothetical protein